MGKYAHFSWYHGKQNKEMGVFNRNSGLEFMV